MKTNSELCEYVKAQLGLPYWYGTYGQTASASLYKSKKKQYPSQYTASDFEKQYGKRVHDCSGLIKGFLMSESPTSTPKYNSKYDTNAKGLYNKASTKGEISTFPKRNGMLLFKSSNGKVTGIYHVGVYIDGKVYNAKGHAYGVVADAYNASKWHYWAQCHWLDDDNDDIPVEIPIDFGNGDKVKILSTATNYYPGGSTIPSWCKDETFIITQTALKGKPVNKGGEQCILLGNRVCPTCGGTITGFNTWISAKNIYHV